MEILKHRVWEFENVWADVLAEEAAELERSKERHPSRFVKKMIAEGILAEKSAE